MTDIDVAKVRSVLEAQQADFQRQIDELDVTSVDAHEFDENFADSGQVAAEQGENLALAMQFRDQLGDVDLALAKLDAGTYGTCEVCGAAIGADRLEALPATRFCIDHA